MICKIHHDFPVSDNETNPCFARGRWAGLGTVTKLPHNAGVETRHASGTSALLLHCCPTRLAIEELTSFYHLFHSSSSLLNFDAPLGFSSGTCLKTRVVGSQDCPDEETLAGPYPNAETMCSMLRLSKWPRGQIRRRRVRVRSQTVHLIEMLDFSHTLTKTFLRGKTILQLDVTAPYQSPQSGSLGWAYLRDST